VSALLQFANYLEQQPVASPTCWVERPQGARAEQDPASKKYPRAVGLNREPTQALPLAQDTEALDQIYVWDDRPSVLRFIEEAGVRRLLIDAHQALDDAFGSDAIKSLSLVRDDEGFDTLFCLVRTRAQLETASRALQAFDESWWLARSEETAGKVNFDFDLV
jgi:hypothetical protein